MRLGRPFHGGKSGAKVPVTLEITETEVLGVYLVRSWPHIDDRGTFARLYCEEAFAEAGLADFSPVQVNLSTNQRVGTLRGMHYQPRPYAEAKLVQAVRGRAFDVALDLRLESPTYLRWVGCDLCADGFVALYIPEGCAHGFVTLEDNTDILYHMGRAYEPGHAEAVRWNDPAFGIDWPITPKVMSEADRTCADYAGQAG